MSTYRKVDKRILRTESNLKEALLSLLQDIDFEKITVKNICAQAKVNRITFYDHYKDKYDILNSIFLDMQHESVEKCRHFNIKNNTAMDPYINVSNYLMAFVGSLKPRIKLVFSITENSGGYIYYAFITFLRGNFKDLIQYSIPESNLLYDIDQTCAFLVSGVISFVVAGIKAGKYKDNNYEQLFYDAQNIVRSILQSNLLIDKNKVTL